MKTIIKYMCESCEEIHEHKECIWECKHCKREICEDCCCEENVLNCEDCCWEDKEDDEEEPN